MAETVQRIVRH